jgi:hypothetical protein
MLVKYFNGGIRLNKISKPEPSQQTNKENEFDGLLVKIENGKPVIYNCGERFYSPKEVLDIEQAAFHAGNTMTVEYPENEKGTVKFLRFYYKDFSDYKNSKP